MRKLGIQENQNSSMVSWIAYSKGGMAMALSKELLDILACPKCKGDIFLNQAGDGLICKSCRLLYQIKDDIPIMLIDEALPYQGEE
jgi:uncharacterized protein YbaR (Trm112 family)